MNTIIESYSFIITYKFYLSLFSSILILLFETTESRLEVPYFPKLLINVIMKTVVMTKNKANIL